MNQTIIWIELPSQIPAAMKAATRSELPRPVLLALTPHVGYALDKIGQSYIRPEDFHSEDDINAIGMKDLPSLDRFCDEVDDWLLNKWDALREYNLHPMHMNWYYFKCLFNSVSIRTYITRRILESEKPHQVYYFDTRNEPVPRELFFVRESVWSRVIPEACLALNIPYKSLGDNSDPSVLNSYPRTQTSVPTSRIKKLSQLLPPSLKGDLKRRSVRWKHFRNRFRRLLSNNPRREPVPRILALEQGYSLGNLLGRMEASGSFNVVHWDVQGGLPPVSQREPITPGSEDGQCPSIPTQKLLEQQGAKLWNEIREMPWFRELVQFSGIDCALILERRLQHCFQTQLPEILDIYVKARRLMGSEAPFAVVAATMGDYARQAVAQAARDEGVPFVIYRHGSSGGHVMEGSKNWEALTFYDHLELQQSDYVLTLGEGDVDYLGSRGEQRAKLVPIGSIALDSLKARPSTTSRSDLLIKLGLDPAKKVVMYVPTTMDGSIRCAPYRGRSPSRMFEMEKRIVELFGRFPDIQLVLKLQESPFFPCSPVAERVRDTGPKNCTLITDPFPSVMHVADMFVIDYASTSFLEMLTTDKPVLFCGYELPWPWASQGPHPTTRQMWKERVVYSEDLDEFLEILRSYLEEGDFGSVQSEDILLKRFGTYLDDGRSIDRASKFLEGLATKQAKETDDRVSLVS